MHIHHTIQSLGHCAQISTIIFAHVFLPHRKALRLDSVYLNLFTLHILFLTLDPSRFCLCFLPVFYKIWAWTLQHFSAHTSNWRIARLGSNILNFLQSG